ncbi:hypothetical protein EJA01_11745 [Rhodovulum iodosum]|nr:ABC-type transport auxiliary lipoprotein family protein [Rhodovulum robiginosum]RSK32981.1 hypothetical protein EJA01_11745 [Rhodovulum robiginosum]
MLRLLILCLALSVSLSGCAAVGALSRTNVPQNVYEIRAPATLPVARGRAQAIDFVVEVPAASGALDTESIMVRPSPTQIQYLPDARWSENAPVMLQTAMVDGFERTGAFRFVGRRPLSTSGDVALVTRLTDFHAALVPGTESAVVRVTLIARLVREDAASVVATRRFSAEVAVADLGNESILAGYDTAAGGVLSDLTEWVLATRRVATGPS